MCEIQQRIREDPFYSVAEHFASSIIYSAPTCLCIVVNANSRGTEIEGIVVNANSRGTEIERQTNLTKWTAPMVASITTPNITETSIAVSV